MEERGTSSPLSHLPYFVKEGQDVYETQEVAQAQVVSFPTTEEAVNADSLDATAISPSSAFAKFADKGMRTPSDFSDSLAAKRRRRKGKGFIPEQTEYEIQDETVIAEKTETPLQRFQRLQNEVKQLHEELAAAAKKQTPLEQDIPSLQVVDELEELQSQLQSLLVKEEAQPFLNPNYRTEQALSIQSTLSKKLLNEIEHFSAAPEASKEKESTPAKSGVISYEVWGAPSASSVDKLSNIAELHSRIEALEKLVGQEAIAQGEHVNIVGVVENLQKKIEQLDPAHLEAVDRKMQALAHDMEGIIRQSEKMNVNPQEEKKVNEMYEMMKRSDVTVKQIPLIIARLQSLKPVHTEALNITSTIKQLQTQQEDITNLLKSNNSVLEQVERGFGDNMKIVQKNIESIQQRIQKISEKVGLPQESKD